VGDSKRNFLRQQSEVECGSCQWSRIVRALFENRQTSADCFLPSL
jgi:hypothetical protein